MAGQVDSEWFRMSSQAVRVTHSPWQVGVEVKALNPSIFTFHAMSSSPVSWRSTRRLLYTGSLALVAAAAAILLTRRFARCRQQSLAPQLGVQSERTACFL